MLLYMLSSWRMYEMHPALSFKTGCDISSPEVGPGATVGTLEHGYPLLKCEGTVPTRLSLDTS
jgi:hypothetical protein